MLYLNLVSSEIKKEIEWRHLYETVRVAAMALAVFCVVIVGVLWGAQKMLEDSFRDNVGQNMSITTNLKQKDIEVDLEKRLQSIVQIDDEFIPWSYFLAGVAKHTNEEITFNSLQINKKGPSIRMKGEAEHRNALLEFKNKMEASDNFSKVIFPVENILKKENVEFNIKAELKLDEFQ